MLIWAKARRRWAGWAGQRIERINRLFACNGQRRQAGFDPPAQPLAALDAEVRHQVQEMKEVLDRELADGQLAGEPEKVLQSLRRHWQGLTVFVDHPQVPMDNNAAERANRPLAVARKNFYGSGAQWSGELACACFTILATLRQQRICPRCYFQAYFEACAPGRPGPRCAGRVPALEMEPGTAGGLAHPGASAMSAEPERRYCGRQFSAVDLAHIRALLQLQPTLGRVALSRRVCQDLGWLNALGQPKAMSARVALLRMEKEGLIQLPAPLTSNGRGQRRFLLTSASDPREPVQEPLHALEPLVFQRVSGGRLSSLWNELIARYHYLGYRPLSGAQMRYLVWSADGRLLAALGFGASAWQVQPRDRHIGWNDRQRRAGLHRIVNNARFLILPWVRCGGLALKRGAGSPTWLVRRRLPEARKSFR